MKFGVLSLEEAAGAILAHSRAAGGQILRKGIVLDAASLALLRADGATNVIAAQLDDDDVGENEAADRLANVLTSAGIRRTRASTGRVNLIADQPGLLEINRSVVERINLIDESITLGTLADGSVLAAGDMIATIKIIPFAVSRARLEEAIAVTNTEPSAIVVHRFRSFRVGLIVTTLPHIKQKIFDDTIAATRIRIEGLGGTLIDTCRCSHESNAVVAAIATLLDRGAELLLIAGASAVVDRRDVCPAAIVGAGGTILHFGLPVDPGNLLCAGRIGSTPVLVLPGCARSPRLNGIDFVLSRLFAGLPLNHEAAARLAVGGLLKEIPSRGLPRAKASSERPTDPVLRIPFRSRTIAAVVLAAGLSSRMAPLNKLLMVDGTGKPMIARVVDNVLASRARPIIVVIGHQAAEVRSALSGKPVQFVEAIDYAAGLSASLRAGIAAVPLACDAVVVALGDMPLVTGTIINRLIDAYDRDEGRLIVAPRYKGAIGNPILWDQQFFQEMLELTGDKGAKELVAQHQHQSTEVEVETDAVLRDFDTPEALKALPVRLRPALGA